MDKNTLWGLLVVGGILFGYTFYNSKQMQKRQDLYKAQQREIFVQDSIDRAMFPEKYSADPEVAAVAAAQFEEVKKQEQVSAEAQRISNIGESLYAAENADESVYTLENDVIKMFISTKGAQVQNVWVKDYKRYSKDGDGAPLMMYADGTAKFDMEFFIRRTYNFAQINTAEYVFTDVREIEVVDKEGNRGQGLSMRLPIDDESGAYLEYIYAVYPGNYMVDFDVKFVGMHDFTANMTDFRFNWEATTLQNEKGFKNENMYTTMAYRYPGAKKVEQLGASESNKSKKEASKISWLSFKQQFFSSIFLAEDDFSSAEFGYRTYKPDYGMMKDFYADLSVPYYNNQNEYKFKFYFGPNKYPILKKQDQKFEKVIPLGGKLIGWINTGFVIPVFNWLSKHIASFGIIILLLTLMIKLIILPLTYKSYMSSAKMRVLKPEMEEINERYPKQEDAMKKQQATMALYKKFGVSPMGGCLPMLIQMPILIAMFRFFPASIELRGQSLLWAEDLSAYDSILDFGFKIPLYGDHISLFTLLMAVCMFFYSKINYKQTAGAGGQQMAGMKFMTVYLMPIMMLCWFNSYASGLTYYYMLSQLITIAIMTGFRYFINEDKMRAKMEAKAAKVAADPNKSKKKSGFQKRYEEAMRQQQQMMREQQGRNNNPSGRSNTTKPQSTKSQPKKKKR